MSGRRVLVVDDSPTGRAAAMNLLHATHAMEIDGSDVETTGTVKPFRTETPKREIGELNPLTKARMLSRYSGRGAETRG